MTSKPQKPEHDQAANSTDLTTQQTPADDPNPATGYIFASANYRDAEIDEDRASASLMHQLLKNGETVEKKKPREKTDSKPQPIVLGQPQDVPLLGTAVSQVQGSRASDSLGVIEGKPVLPTASRTSMLHERGQKGNPLWFAGVAAGAVLAVGGGIFAVKSMSPTETVSHEVVQESPLETTAPASPSPSPTTLEPAPVPSIIERVPEVYYVEPTDQPVAPGTVEYVEEAAPVEVAPVELPPVVEVPPVEPAPVEPAPTLEPTLTPEPQVTETPAEVTPTPAPVETPAPTEPTAPETGQILPTAPATQPGAEQTAPANQGVLPPTPAPVASTQQEGSLPQPTPDQPSQGSQQETGQLDQQAGQEGQASS